MSSDMLSQDDIDNLLQGDGGEGSAGASAPAQSGGDAEPESLRPSLNVFSEQISTVLVTVLGKEITTSITNLGKSDEDKIKSDYGSDALILKVELTGKINGPLFFIYSKKEVATLSDLMMMGDGSAEYEEDHKDAISELTNQIMGAVTSTIGSTFDAKISSATPTVEDFVPDTSPVDLSAAIAANIDIKIEEVSEGKFIILIPQSTANEMSAATQAGGASGAGGEENFDFSDAGGQGAGLSMDSFSQPSGQLANDKSGQFSSTGNPKMEMLMDVTLQVSIELGRTEMSIKRILELGPGSIIELDRMAGEPVDLLVNDKVVAKGEVVVVDENFGIRVVKLVTPEERLKNLR